MVASATTAVVGLSLWTIGIKLPDHLPGYAAGERAICQGFADDVIRGQIAPEVAFDPAAPCGRAGFLVDCGSLVQGPAAHLIFRKGPCPKPNQAASKGLKFPP